MFDLSLRIHNWATKHVEERTKAASQAHSGALSSAGFRLRQLTQTGMRQQAPGDIAWPPASPWVQFGASLLARARARQKRRRGGRNFTPLGPGSQGRTPLKRLAGAVRYEKQVQSGPGGGVALTTVRMGFLTAKVAARAAYHAEAHTVPVTPKMRRLIFAVGLGISKSTLTIPARPHVEPVYRKNQARISGFCKQRVNAAWTGSDPKGIALPF